MAVVLSSPIAFNHGNIQDLCSTMLLQSSTPPLVGNFEWVSCKDGVKALLTDSSTGSGGAAVDLSACLSLLLRRGGSSPSLLLTRRRRSC
ncbi:hypothetical protein RIF29_14888 [Crotalaria pallida]|uniref:Uncharacterized protein n=1 Tax=Crotalaria pallida TaxID=3830 RepID=A0AAN9FCJ6_CROPI